MIICNNKEVVISEKINGFDLIEKLNMRKPEEAIALLVNGEYRDFFDEITPGDRVEIIGFEDHRGKDVFWHTSAHVLAQAVLRLWPNAKPTIGPPISEGFYYDFADLHISEGDFQKIEDEIQNVLKENYKVKRETFKNKDEALEKFKKNPYKGELINEFSDNSIITIYQQGEFFDLCRGPHLSSFTKIKAIKLMKTSAAHWRGDQKREMLTRIYGVSYPDKKLLKEYLIMLEEAKRRDHRILGKSLQLFSFLDCAPGMPLFEPNGMIIFNNLLKFWRELHSEAGYKEIKTPQLLDKKLWEKSGHWENYRENMYTLNVDEMEYAVKPMNCPACMLYYASKKHSYRELPLRIAEIGNVHRHELSGSLSGLLRVRSFHQDDAHIFMTIDHVKSEIINVLKLVDTIYKTFGLDYHLELSTRPNKKTIGSDEDWEKTTNGLRCALEEWGAPYKINEGDGAFYGPKIDLHVKDVLGRSWQCGTIQLDMALPERFELEYNSGDNCIYKRPIMMHRAIYGSIERFFAIIIEHFAGRFPLWISPKQVRIITVAERHINYANIVKKQITQSGILCEIDDSLETVGKKVRCAQLDQVNYVLTIGDCESKNQTVTIRTRESKAIVEIVVQDFLEKASKELLTRSLTPFFK